MPAFLLPAYCAVHQAVNTLSAAGALHPKGDTEILTFSDIPAMDVLVFLVAWWLMARSTGTTIKLRGEAITLAARQLLGFHRLFDIQLSRTNAYIQPAKAPTLGVLPLTPIATEEQKFHRPLMPSAPSPTPPPKHLVWSAPYTAPSNSVSASASATWVADWWVPCNPPSPRCAATGKFFRRILSEKT